MINSLQYLDCSFFNQTKKIAYLSEIASWLLVFMKHTILTAVIKNIGGVAFLK